MQEGCKTVVDEPSVAKLVDSACYERFVCLDFNLTLIVGPLHFVFTTKTDSENSSANLTLQPTQIFAFALTLAVLRPYPVREAEDHRSLQKSLSSNAANPIHSASVVVSIVIIAL